MSKQKYFDYHIEWLKANYSKVNNYGELLNIFNEHFNMQINKDTLYLICSDHKIMPKCFYQNKKNKTRVFWFKNNIKKYKNLDDLCNAFNKEFNENLSSKTICDYMYNNGLKSNYNANRVWKKEHIQWLKDNKDNYPDLHTILQDFNKKFGLNYTREQLKSARKCYKLNLNKVKTNNSECGAGNFKQIGSERKNSNNGIVIKADDNRWISKSKYIYEKLNHCRLKKDDVVLHLNGDKNDYSKDNLYATSKAVLIFIESRHWHFTNKEDTLARIKYVELYKCIKENKNE